MRTPLLLLLLIHHIQGKLFDTSGELLTRQKRTLIFIEGVNWVQLIVGVGLPIELRDQSITIGPSVKAFYLLPTNASEYTHPTIDYERKKRSATRWITYGLIESFFERYGQNDGKACLLRTICEYSGRPFDRKAGILSEIAHAILTPSSTKDAMDEYANSDYYAAERLGRKGDCVRLFPECRVDFMQMFSRFLS